MRAVVAGFLLCVAAVGLCQAAPVSDLKDGRVGTIAFASRTPTGPTEMMAGGGRQSTITGQLVIPTTSQTPAPAMIIMHGSGGILPGRENEWAARLNEMGVATFVVDSFGPRGFTSTGDDQSRLPLAASVTDALTALKLLSSHPGIARDRIGIVGYSKGGQIALYTTLEPFRRAVIDDDLRFALHIAFYSSCSIPYKSEEVSAAPVFLLLGGDDDYTPAAHCGRYVDFLRSKGAPVEMFVFTGAHHGFDLPTPVRYLPRAQTARDCGLDIALDPVVARRWDTGLVVPPSDIGAYLRSCMQRGASYGGNPSARAEAGQIVDRAVQTFLLKRQ
ncbi:MULTISPECIES: dienelactone hydrolase family protein [unclassified Chelatococcus]|uniref:dienelactone hydrolase family protein n=1 Tax=unclassified Chelatococcus TaxID=2638111 RepID=UPI001BCAE95B|nr:MULTISPECIES: dienelactone hydrolase family protein [unclassified Chelatococcus]MBS7698823.1 dienelactone hydrolase family protein [Chelatococcus sp. YT9]MBX3560088.1 dienelactone hydrolase family protein [Chelatococcus sp.]